MKIPVFGQPQPGLTYSRRPGSYAFLKNQSGFLAAIRTSYGCFLPGGGADPGETPEDTLRREVFEEIGFELSNIRPLGEAQQYVFSRFYNQGFLKHGYFFEADWAPHPLGRIAHDHFLDWLSAEDLTDALTHEFQRWMAKKSLGV